MSRCERPAGDDAAFNQQLLAHAAGIVARRAALIVGIDSYDSARSGLNPLPNATNDAELIADVSEYAGYHVICFINLERRHFDAIASFITAHAPGKDAPEGSNDRGHLFFYFAGHGFQSTGGTYILPTDYANTPDPLGVAVGVRAWLNRLRAAAPFLVAVIDACRAPPPPGAGALAQGPAAVDADSGKALLLYSSGPGELAGETGPVAGYGAFAPYLAEAAELPGLSFGTLFDVTFFRTSESKRQTPQIVKGVRDHNQLFHPSTDTAEDFFAFALNGTFNTRPPQDCPSVITSLFSIVEAHFTALKRARTIKALGGFMETWRQCAALGSRVGLMLTAAPGSALRIVGPGSGGRVSQAASLFWYGEGDQSALMVRAVDPESAYAGTGSVKPLDVQISASPSQIVQQDLDPDRVFDASLAMQEPMLLVRFPRTNEEALSLLQLQGRLNEIAQPLGLQAPQVEAIPEHGAATALLPVEAAGVLIDQAAVRSSLIWPTRRPAFPIGW